MGDLPQNDSGLEGITAKGKEIIDNIIKDGKFSFYERGMGQYGGDLDNLVNKGIIEISGHACDQPQMYKLSRKGEELKIPQLQESDHEIDDY